MKAPIRFVFMIAMLVISNSGMQFSPPAPNPFNPDTWLPYQLSEASDVMIRIFNPQGQLVRSLAVGHREPGIYLSRERAAYWNGRNEVGEAVSSGIYFYSIEAGGFAATKKLVVAR